MRVCTMFACLLFALLPSLGETASSLDDLIQTDPKVTGFESYAAKQYRLSYSDQVDGGLVRIRTQMKGEDGAVREKELRFR